MIILTADQATKVSGISPTNPQAVIQPFALKDGTFMLHEDVLSDPAHADATAFLATLPTVKSVDPTLIYPSGPKATTQQKTDYATATALVPKWEDVGVRQAIAIQAVDEVALTSP